MGQVIREAAAVSGMRDDATPWGPWQPCPAPACGCPGRHTMPRWACTESWVLGATGPRCPQSPGRQEGRHWAWGGGWLVRKYPDPPLPPPATRRTTEQPARLRTAAARLVPKPQTCPRTPQDTLPSLNPDAMLPPPRVQRGLARLAWAQGWAGSFRFTRPPGRGPVQTGNWTCPQTFPIFHTVLPPSPQTPPLGVPRAAGLAPHPRQCQPQDKDREAWGRPSSLAQGGRCPHSMPLGAWPLFCWKGDS